jgi:hypothetical protein
MHSADRPGDPGKVAIVVVEADVRVVLVVFVIASPVVTLPVKVGDARGAFVPRAVVMVDA